MTKFLLVVFSILTSILLAGCVGPHSRTYKPVSEWETRAFSKANRNVFPNDVRNNFSVYDSSRVAWPGIVLIAESKPVDSVLEVHFTIEHHYYDWIEDFSIQQKRIFLSPRGEGKFTTIWRLKATADTTIINKSVGNMIIVYGIPSSITDSVISVEAYYVRTIDRPWFGTDIMDYGRPGEPVKILRIP